MRFLDHVPQNRSSGFQRNNGCIVCANIPLFDALYEFSKAKEVLGTTDLTINDFHRTYAKPVYGQMANIRYLNHCLSKHIRPALRYEIWRSELEEERREGRAASQQDIDDFCLGRPPSNELLARFQKSVSDAGYGNSARTPMVSEGAEAMLPPEDGVDFELYHLAEMERAIYDPSLDRGVTRYALIYWRDAIDRDRIRAREQSSG